MIRKIKTVGVVFAAILAVSAVSASAASAATSGLTPGTNVVILTANQTTAQKLVLGASGTTIKCSTSNLEGTSSVATGIINHATMKPIYGGCTLGGLTATVTTGTCEYTITDTTTALRAHVDVINCGANNIAITQGTCVINIGNLTTLAHIGFANNTNNNPDDVDVTLTINSVGYTGGAGCPANVQGARNDGALTGGYTLRAYADNSGSEGGQVNLTAH